MRDQKNKIRVSVPLKKEVYALLEKMSEQQGVSMASLASQVISNHITTYQTLFNTMNNPETLLELAKLLEKGSTTKI